MYGLSKEEKLKFIIEKSEELAVTAYEFGNNTELSDIGARNILSGESKKPREKNLNIMLEYLENKVLGSKLDNKEGDFPLLKEPHSKYIPKKTKDKVVPYYDIVIAKQSMASFEDVREHIEYYIDFKPLNDCTAYLPYFGNAMQPMFCSGNTLAVKAI